MKHNFLQTLYCPLIYRIFVPKNTTPGKLYTVSNFYLGKQHNLQWNVSITFRTNVIRTNGFEQMTIRTNVIRTKVIRTNVIRTNVFEQTYSNKRFSNKCHSNM